jgi:hypothetical protein
MSHFIVTKKDTSPYYLINDEYLILEQYFFIIRIKPVITLK